MNRVWKGFGVFISILLSLSPTPYQILLLEAGIEYSRILIWRKYIYSNIKVCIHPFYKLIFYKIINLVDFKRQYDWLVITKEKHLKIKILINFIKLWKRGN